MINFNLHTRQIRRNLWAGADERGRMMNTIKVAIVDDHSLFLRGLQRVLSADKRLDVCLIAVNGEDLMEKLNNGSVIPELILLDLQMPAMDGFTTVRYLRNVYPQIKVVIISQHHETELIYVMVKSGVSGFISKTLDFELLRATVIDTVERGFYFDELTKKLIARRSMFKPENEQPLTEQEAELVKMLCSQKSVKQIATELQVSIRTVEARKNFLLEKTKSRNMAGIMMYALTHGLLTEDQSSSPITGTDV